MSLIFDNVHKSSSKVDQKECVYAERRRYGEGVGGGGRCGGCERMGRVVCLGGCGWCGEADCVQ